MSKFKTAIAVDVEAVKKLLPQGSYVHGVDWNRETQSVELTWEHDGVITPYSFAADFPLAAMKGQEPLPAFIKVKRGLGQRTEDGSQKSEATADLRPPISDAPATSVPTVAPEVVEKPRRRR